MTGLSHSFESSISQESASIEVEVLPSDRAPTHAPRGVKLSGDAARAVRDAFGSGLIEVGRTASRAGETTYRLVPSEKLNAGLVDKTLLWDTPGKGDASVVVRNKATGRIAGRAELQRVKAGPAKVLGPAAWQAMAMATQQHYLTEINDKLRGVESGVNEVLAAMDDEKRGTLAKVQRVVHSSQQRVARGDALSEGTRRELSDGAQRADEVWHQLFSRMRRHLDRYRSGDLSAADIEVSWAMLLHATEVLGASSAFLTSLSFDSEEALEGAAVDERERILHALASIRALAGELYATHRSWASASMGWHLSRTRNPVRMAVRAAQGTGLPKPSTDPLNDHVAWRASRIALPPTPPAAMLLTARSDGTLVLATE